jgi:hypothetical protein
MSKRVGMIAASELLDRIKAELNVPSRVAMGLFRRCCAMVNFFVVESNRELAGVDDAKPGPAIWMAAASAPVHQLRCGGRNSAPGLPTPQFYSTLSLFGSQWRPLAGSRCIIAAPMMEKFCSILSAGMKRMTAALLF